MLAIIDEIGDVARLQLGQPLSLQLGPVELGELARAVVEEFALAGTARVTVSTPVAEVMVLGDRARLLRVVRNLIDNGLKFSPEGTPVRVDVLREGDVAMIVVRDRGAGIAPADLPRVFQRFFRAPGATRVRGSGLGLAGARAIMEQHGGEIAIDSVVGEGTTVTLRLPAGRQPRRPLARPLHGSGDSAPESL
jgi:signal transduction histidine kinase